MTRSFPLWRVVHKHARRSACVASLRAGTRARRALVSARSTPACERDFPMLHLIPVGGAAVLCPPSPPTGCPPPSDYQGQPQPAQRFCGRFAPARPKSQVPRAGRRRRHGHIQVRASARTCNERVIHHSDPHRRRVSFTPSMPQLYPLVCRMSIPHIRLLAAISGCNMVVLRIPGGNGYYCAQRRVANAS